MRWRASLDSDLGQTPSYGATLAPALDNLPLRRQACEALASRS